jgi:hypothetical protein
MPEERGFDSDGVLEILIDNFSGPIVPGSTQPVTAMSTRDLPWG